jgi:hypothetical protein
MGGKLKRHEQGRPGGLLRDGACEGYQDSQQRAFIEKLTNLPLSMDPSRQKRRWATTGRCPRRVDAGEQPRDDCNTCRKL